MRQNFYHLFFRFFASLRLTAFVISTLAISCLVGMFWDQTLSLQEHLGTLSQSPMMLAFFQFFELNDVFHAWWFSILVVLLALNLIACSIERLPKIWIDARHPLVWPSDRDFSLMPHKVRLESMRVDLLGSFLPPECKEKAEENVHFYFWQKHQYARCGVYFVHIALLMIMFGSIYTTIFGIDGMMMIQEGHSEQIVQAKGPGALRYPHPLDFFVVCKDFRLKTFVDNSPMEYESDLAIYDPREKENPVSQKTIRVNEPLSYEGYTFYQASYQAMRGEELLKIAYAPHGGKQELKAIKAGERIVLPGGDVLIPLEYIDNYGGLSEAVRMQYIESGKEPTSFVVFRQYPDFDPLVRRGKVDVFFQGVDQPFATGVSVGKTPALNVVFAGFILMFVGMYMAFLQNQRRYYLRIKPLLSGGYEVLFAGRAHRHLYAFADEFNNLATRLERLCREKNAK